MNQGTQLGIEEIRFLFRLVPRRYPEYEEQIFQDDSMLYEYMVGLYAMSPSGKTVDKGRIKESMSFALYFYATNEMESRWPIAEPIIMRDPHYVYYYSLLIVGGRWYEAENFLLTPNLQIENAHDIPRWIYYYTKFIIKRRWLESEAILSTNEEWHKEYKILCDNFDNAASVQIT
jgi:hypothetical protein